MSYKAHTFVVAVLGIGLAVGHVNPASAAVLSYEQTASGRTGSGTATSYLSLPTTDTYSRSFNSPTTQIGTTGFGFYDDFIFSVSSATADAITSTIDFANVLLNLVPTPLPAALPLLSGLGILGGAVRRRSAKPAQA
jgi:hypothetical protein